MKRPRSSAEIDREVGGERLRHFFFGEADVARGSALPGLGVLAPVDHHQPALGSQDRSPVRAGRALPSDSRARWRWCRRHPRWRAGVEAPLRARSRGSDRQRRHVTQDQAYVGRHASPAVVVVHLGLKFHGVDRPRGERGHAVGVEAGPAAQVEQVFVPAQGEETGQILLAHLGLAGGGGRSGGGHGLGVCGRRGRA